MSSFDDNSYIDELKKSLYSRTAPEVRTRRKLRFSDKENDVKTDWNEKKDVSTEPVLNNKYENHKMSFLIKLLIASFVFCVVAVGVGAYIFLNGTNLISANNISIDINGPVSIPGGEVVPFDIKVTNNNNVDLELVDMSVDFPDGTTNSDDPTQELKNYTELLGNIAPGASAQKTVKAIIFGEENIQKEITVNISYKIKGSNSMFNKSAVYDVLINSSPIDVTATSFKEITSGQEFDMKVTLKSNSQETLKSVLLKAVYPFGFSFISASPQSLSDNSTWKIGDIPPGGQRIVTIHGKLTGEDSDTRAFHFNVGAQSQKNPSNIGTQYLSVEQDMTIQKPFVSLSISVNGDNSNEDYVSQFGQSERVSIQWFNNLSVSISNAAITVNLSGTAYDKMSIFPDSGYFDSANNQIIWNQKTNADFASISAGENGTVSFMITPKDSSTGSNLVVNPFVNINASVTGNRTQESNVSGSLTSTVTKNMKINTDISLSGRIVRSTGPFQNTGPIPPKAEKESTYTVIWDVDNTSNSVLNAQVTATLPPYIKWVNSFNPSTEIVSYDPNSGQVTWNIGNVGTYTSGSSNRKELAFQISFTPGANQIGTPADLVKMALLKATDSFTNSILSSKQDNLTTRFSTDPNYNNGDEIVSK